ncbi:hypothetical protein GYM62_10520 [Algoriphagus sp. NBT04N3]|uniref:DUF5675 domain-containing protein n=1 Tax=Aquiflexum balticum DSM 16537 TaxID=758820 RepID=A0A1W2H7T8_9BACT|nr:MULTISPECIES: DUF5675 family protein [Cyclobacteriaceae]QYH39205.1 hypothetical protein GYM62_10520 [Algoriphagus sp. NBT04N3]SMD44708.1 hypothetical protein SAMN00777080_3336 [Aquiflexum balticum DSM 16537]
MELILTRSYYPEGTNGKLRDGEQLVCSTIELPWRENQRMVSSIPEGRYELVKRYTDKRGWHLLVKNVPNRSGILFHPANDALKELKGCIAPVSKVIGPGKGTDSKTADSRLKTLVFEAMERGENVFLNIQKAKSV